MSKAGHIRAIEADLAEKVLRAVAAAQLPAEVELRLIVELRARGIPRHG